MFFGKYATCVGFAPPTAAADPADAWLARNPPLAYDPPVDGFFFRENESFRRDDMAWFEVEYNRGNDTSGRQPTYSGTATQLQQSRRKPNTATPNTHNRERTKGKRNKRGTRGDEGYYLEEYVRVFVC